MKFHEALRGILRLYGFELMEDETGRLFELLRKYRAFEELPCLWDALRLVMYSSRTASGSAEALSDGARLYRLSLLPEITGYLRCADALRKSLVWQGHLSGALASYLVDSISYALGVTCSEKSSADLSARLLDLVISDAGLAAPSRSGRSGRIRAVRMPSFRDLAGHLRAWLRRLLLIAAASAAACLLFWLAADDPAGTAEAWYAKALGWAGSLQCRSGDDAGCGRAAGLYRRAAELGDADAAGRLGTMYCLGLGTYRNYDEAAKWLGMAARRGNAEAEAALGVLYYFGLGVRQDYLEALRWFRKAADQGSAMARNNLAAMYYTAGQGVRENRAEAEKWLAMSRGGRATADGEVAGVISGIARDGAQSAGEALERYREAAEGGDAPSQYYLGFLSEHGTAVKQDYAEALSWYRMAAENGSALAQNRLGEMYERGEVVSQNYGAAAGWYRAAAGNGNAAAAESLVRLYDDGLAVPPDEVEAEKWRLMAEGRGASGGMRAPGQAPLR